MPKIKLLSYNIHKSKHFLWRQSSLKTIAHAVSSYAADIVLMQEVFHSNNPSGMEHQSQFLAKAFQQRFYYESNAHYNNGHHGNATFSNLKHLHTSNFLLTQNRFEHRGLLYTIFELPNQVQLHLFNTHLNLRSKDRLNQADLIVKIIKNLEIPAAAPLIIGGDFNDWLLEVSPTFINELGLLDSSQHHIKKTAHEYATFPALAPQVNIDRFYYKNMRLLSFEVEKGFNFRFISDHLPVLANFEY